MTSQGSSDICPDKTLNQEPTGNQQGFAGNVMSLSISSAVSQLIKLLSAPLISRIFGPGAFGAASVFDSASRTLVPISALGYPTSLVLPERQEEAANIFSLSCLLVLCTTAMAAGLVTLAGEPLLRAAHVPQLIPYKWLFPAALLLAGMAEPLSFWNTRHKQFKRKALAQVCGAGLSVGVILTLGVLGFVGGQSLVFGMLLIPLAVAGMLGLSFWREDLAFVASHVSVRGMWLAAWRHRQFPMFGAWSQLFNIASLQVPSILLASMFSPEAAGLYAYSVALLTMPMSVITTAIGDVFYQHASATKTAGGDLSESVLNVYKSLLAVSLMPIVIVMLIGPELFSLLLGRQWYESGIYSSILAPWLLCSFVFAPLTCLYAIMERQRTFLLFNAALFAGRIVIIVLGAQMFHQVRPTLAVFSAFGAAVAIAQTGYFARAVRTGVMPLLKQFLLHLCYAGPSMAVLAGAKWALGLSPALLIGVAALSVGPYAACVYSRDKELRAVFHEVVGQWRRVGR